MNVNINICIKVCLLRQQKTTLKQIYIFYLFFSVYNLPFIINNFLHLSYLVSLQFANYPEHFWEPSSWPGVGHKAKAWQNHREPNIVREEGPCAFHKQNPNLLCLHLPLLVLEQSKLLAWKTWPSCSPRCSPPPLHCGALDLQGWCRGSLVCSPCVLTSCKGG